MSTESLALLAASLGAGGAIVAQVIAALFTARRETKRLNWERERAEQADHLAIDARFLDLRREVFARWLEATMEWRRLTVVQSMQARYDALPEPDPKLMEARETAWRLLADIALIAPEIEQAAQAIFDHCFTGQSMVETGVPLDYWHGEMNALFETCRSAMRRNLGIRR